MPNRTPEEPESLPEFLVQGAIEYGLLEKIWTCERVAQIVAWEFGVKYRKNHVAHLLKNWICSPKVRTRDVRYDDEEITRPVSKRGVP